VGTGDVSLQIAYQKYKAFLDAQKTYNDMVREKTWTIKKPTKVDLIELFVSKSFFHSHYKTYFSKVAGYADMTAWLEENEDGPSDVDVWGIKRENYTFSDLMAWLENGGTLEVDEDEDYKYKEKKKGRKGKEKEKEKEMVVERKKDKKAEKDATKKKEKKKDSGKAK
jgi:hypothetical protein